MDTGGLWAQLGRIHPDKNRRDVCATRVCATRDALKGHRPGCHPEPREGHPHLAANGRIVYTSFRLWNGKLVTSSTELRQSRIKFLKEIGGRLLPSLRYLMATEVHAYAFSIAANVYLSFFPFTLLLLTVCRRWLRWESAYAVILELLRIHLPKGADSIIRNLSQLAQGRPRLQLISVMMLFFTSSGVFLPLEVALNQVWSIPRNRSFLKNQAMSFFLAVTTGLMAFVSILLSTAAQWVLSHTLGWLLAPGLVGGISRVLMETLSVPLAVATCFVIYFFLPNGQVPVKQVVPAAMIGGILTEIGKLIYMLTLPLFRFREIYGPYEVSATLLFWAYGAALMLLFGAHLSAHGSFIPGTEGRNTT